MKNNILIHLPHSSLYIPEEYRRTALISQKELEEENLFMCDTGISGLVPEALRENTLVFPYSRLYCDVEKFRDGRELMDAYGMGYIYTRDSRGREMFRPDAEHRSEVDRIYEEHHRRLDERVTCILEEFGSCKIIDLHSFSDATVKRIFGINGCPDVCIGTEPDYYDEALTEAIIGLLHAMGLSTAMNFPYKGAIVPNRYFGMKGTGIVSVMLEINKRVLGDAELLLKNL